jgi:formylglycine-generating enzyme required for sulfatase activity
MKIKSRLPLLFVFGLTAALCVVVGVVLTYGRERAQKVFKSGEVVTFAGDSSWKVLDAANVGSSLYYRLPLNPAWADVVSNRLLARTDGYFVVVHYAIKNETNEEVRLWSRMTVVDSRGRQFSEYDNETSYLPENARTISLEALPSGMWREFYAVFEVAADATGLKFQIRSLAINRSLRPAGTALVDLDLRSVPTPTPPPELSLTQVPTPTPEPTPVPTPPAPTPVYTSLPSPPRMATVPADAFMMGCSQAENEYGEDEQPAHQVTLKSYLMSVAETTNEQYAACVQVGACTASNCASAVQWNGATQPVVCVDWNQAAAYCRWIGGRLPTEAEWENAALAGTTGPRYGPLDDIAWYSSNSGGVTHPVGQKQPNAWGLYDMLGNVWEWTADWYDNYQSSASNNPQGPSSGTARVLRGGSWGCSPSDVRASRRGSDRPNDWGDNIGFRCSRDVDSQPTPTPMPTPSN